MYRNLNANSSTTQKEAAHLKEIKKALMTIPGIGKAGAEDLIDLGIMSPSDLIGKHPETLFRELEKRTGKRQDRCVLYVFRAAVYYAETPFPEPEKLKWWNWKEPATDND